MIFNRKAQLLILLLILKYFEKTSNVSDVYMYTLPALMVLIHQRRGQVYRRRQQRFRQDYMLRAIDQEARNEFFALLNLKLRSFAFRLQFGVSTRTPTEPYAMLTPENFQE